MPRLLRWHDDDGSSPLRDGPMAADDDDDDDDDGDDDYHWHYDHDDDAKSSTS